MAIQLNPSSGVPLYFQLVEQIKHAIETGAMKSGDQLPSVRKMAEDLLINPNTVARSYRELEHEGVIELKHGAGAYIRESIVPRARVMQKAQHIVKTALDQLTTLNLSEDEIRRLVETDCSRRRALKQQRKKYA